MLGSFNLGDDVSREVFSSSLKMFAGHMQKPRSVGPAGRRVSNTRMDTDDNRTLQHNFLLNFMNKTASDRAYELIAQNIEPSESFHRGVIGKVCDAASTCREEREHSEVEA